MSLKNPDEIANKKSIEESASSESQEIAFQQDDNNNNSEFPQETNTFSRNIHSNDIHTSNATEITEDPELISDDHSNPSLSADYSHPSLSSSEHSNPSLSADYSNPSLSADYSHPSLSSSDYSNPSLSANYNDESISLSGITSVPHSSHDPSISMSGMSRSLNVTPPSDQSIFSRIRRFEDSREADLIMDDASPRIIKLTGIGSILDRKYKIIRQIAVGGMGIVFAAVHIKLEKTVAIKVLSPGTLNDKEARERFIREAKASTLLSNPHTVRVYDYNITKWGEPYLVMEYIKGQTLRHLVKKEKSLPLLRSVDITKQIAQSLIEAHNYDLIHRDLKPSNIMLMQIKGHNDFVKLFDFGIAKFATQSDDDELTKQGTMLGTPRYMAPEQIKAVKTVSCAVDIFSLALIFFNMVTGEKPFAEYPSESLLYFRLKSKPPTLPTNMDIPNGLHKLYAKMTHKDPARRPSAEDIVTELTFLEAELKVGTFSGAYSISKPTSKFKSFIYPTIILVLLSVIGFIFLHKQIKPTTKTKSNLTVVVPKVIKPKIVKPKIVKQPKKKIISPIIPTKITKKQKPKKSKKPSKYKKKVASNRKSRKSRKNRFIWIKIVTRPSRVKVWKGKRKKYLGKTPLKIKKFYYQPIKLRFKKAGYFSSSLIIPKRKYKKRYFIRLRAARIEMP